MDITFLSSTRFWVLVGVVIVSFLRVHTWIDTSIADALITFGLGFIGIKTVDRASEKLGGQ